MVHVNPSNGEPNQADVAADARLDTLDRTVGKAVTPESPLVIPVIAETLQVGQRMLEGAVRIRKVVHENPIAVDAMLRDERVSIERIAIGRNLDGPVGIRHEGDVMIVPIVEERLVVEKRLVLVEEIRIRREPQTRREPQHVTLRQEQVLVERLDPKTQTWSNVETTSKDGATAEPVDRLAV